MNLFPAAVYPAADRGPVIGLRPERIRFVPVTAGAKLVGRVAAVENIGGEAIVHVDVHDHRLLARVPRGVAPARGAEIGIDFDHSDLHAFDGNDGRAVA